jgi:hypothetical protein
MDLLQDGIPKNTFTNILHMKTYLNILQSVIIILIISLNSYAMANGIRLGSSWGIVMSLASLAALVYCIHLFKKLKEIDSEEDYGNY